ncbi:MAG: hypothetical protein GY909_07000 [Oligoflexia bacterium]|nr:hypothetical protein [Oligoflexia bacterium]
MKKINVILHETTIINFPFFWKLIKRYAVISVIAPIIALCVGAYVYLSQNDIYLKSASFKYQVDSAEASSSSIASIIGEKSQGLSPNEILGIMTSFDFAKQVATTLVNHKDILKFNFTPIKSKDMVSTPDMMAKCGDDFDCKVKSVQVIIPYLYVMEPDRLIENRFWVRVKSLDRFTTETLTDILINELVKSRVNTIKHSITEQIKLSHELVDSKREELIGVDMMAVRDRKKEVSSLIEEITSKIKNYNSFYHQQKLKMTLAETKYNQTKNTISKKKVNQEDVETFKKRTELKDKIKKIQEDITAIKLSSQSLSSQDSIIIDQLNLELKETKEKLGKLGGNGRSISNIVKFLDKKDKESDFNEFDYKVLKGQFAKIQKDYQAMIDKRDALEAEDRKLDNTLEQYKPSFEYIKLLEQKIIQLKLLESTVISDFIFDKEMANVRRFKRTSRSKITLFSVTTSIFLLFLLILIRYVSDDRIYDTYELEKSFEELTIIGNTPDFD